MCLAPFYLALEPSLLLGPVQNQNLPSRGRKCAPHLPQCFISSMLARRYFRHSSGHSPLSSLHFQCERICSTNPSDFKGPHKHVCYRGHHALVVIAAMKSQRFTLKRHLTLEDSFPPGLLRRASASVLMHICACFQDNQSLPMHVCHQ